MATVTVSALNQFRCRAPGTATPDHPLDLVRLDQIGQPVGTKDDGVTRTPREGPKRHAHLRVPQCLGKTLAAIGLATEVIDGQLLSGLAPADQEGGTVADIRDDQLLVCNERGYQRGRHVVTTAAGFNIHIRSSALDRVVEPVDWVT